MPFLKEYLAKQGINVVAVPGQGVALRDKQMLAASSGDATYDVYLAWDALMPLLQKYGEPLDTYLQSAGVDVSGFEAKFYPNVVANASADGKLYWIPIHINAQIGYARRDLFMDPNEQAAFKAKYGYDLPQPDSTGVLNFPTKKVFVDVAQFFTRAGSDGQTNLWGYVMAGKWDQGNTVFEEEMFRAGLGYFDQKGHSDWGPCGTPESADREGYCNLRLQLDQHVEGMLAGRPGNGAHRDRATVRNGQGGHVVHLERRQLASVQGNRFRKEIWAAALLDSLVHGSIPERQGADVRLGMGIEQEQQEQGRSCEVPPCRCG